MGQESSGIQAYSYLYQFPLHQYTIKNRLNSGLATWQNRNPPFNQLIQYKMVLNNKQQLKQISQLFQFRYQHRFLVSCLYMTCEQQGIKGCGQLYKGSIYYQQTIASLSQINDIPFKDTLHIYAVALRGFQILYKKFGYFDIFEDMFHICESGKLKVWCNSAPYKLVPQPYLLDTTGLQQDMIHRIIHIIDENSDRNDKFNVKREIQQKVMLVQRNSGKRVWGFQNMIAVFRMICRQNQWQPPQRLQCLASFSREQIQKLLIQQQFQQNSYHKTANEITSNYLNQQNTKSPQQKMVSLEYISNNNFQETTLRKQIEKKNNQLENIKTAKHILPAPLNQYQPEKRFMTGFNSQNQIPQVANSEQKHLIRTQSQQNINNFQTNNSLHSNFINLRNQAPLQNLGIKFAQQKPQGIQLTQTQMRKDNKIPFLNQQLSNRLTYTFSKPPLPKKNISMTQNRQQIVIPQQFTHYQPLRKNSNQRTITFNRSMSPIQRVHPPPVCFIHTPIINNSPPHFPQKNLSQNSVTPNNTHPSPDSIRQYFPVLHKRKEELTPPKRTSSSKLQRVNFRPRYSSSLRKNSQSIQKIKNFNNNYSYLNSYQSNKEMQHASNKNLNFNVEKKEMYLLQKPINPFILIKDESSSLKRNQSQKQFRSYKPDLEQYTNPDLLFFLSEQQNQKQTESKIEPSRDINCAQKLLSFSDRKFFYQLPQKYTIHQNIFESQQRSTSQELNPDQYQQEQQLRHIKDSTHYRSCQDSMQLNENSLKKYDHGVDNEIWKDLVHFKNRRIDASSTIKNPFTQ